MNIEICKYTGKDKQPANSFYRILSYDIISQNNSLLLVSEDQMSDENDVKSDFFEIFKVQFIASCKTEFKEGARLLVAFYLKEGELHAYILSTLEGDCYPTGGNLTLIDYKSYLEICEYTGEAKLSLVEYLQEIRSGTLGTNALLMNNGTLLNYSEQKEHYKTLENLKMGETA